MLSAQPTVAVRTCFISPYEKKQRSVSRTGERQKSLSAVYQNVIAAPFMALVNLAG
jgi:hypothetical protein